MDRIDSSITMVEYQRTLVPPTWENTVREVGLDELDVAGRSLAHSFAADGLSQYILDSEDTAGWSAERKWKLHVTIMNTIVASHVLKGSVTTIGPDHDALAIWETPGKDSSGWWTMFRSGMFKLYFQLPGECRNRYYKEVLPQLSRTLVDVLGDRATKCYYLVYVGTKPNARGKGYAKKLIRHMIAKADADNCPMYLESSSLANNAYYERFGFQVRKTIELGSGRSLVKLNIMVREPQPGGKADSSPGMRRLGSIKVQWSSGEKCKTLKEEEE